MPTSALGAAFNDYQRRSMVALLDLPSDNHKLAFCVACGERNAHLLFSCLAGKEMYSDAQYIIGEIWKTATKTECESDSIGLLAIKAQELCARMMEQDPPLPEEAAIFCDIIQNAIQYGQTRDIAFAKKCGSWSLEAVKECLKRKYTQQLWAELGPDWIASNKHSSDYTKLMNGIDDKIANDPAFMNEIAAQISVLRVLKDHSTVSVDCVSSVRDHVHGSLGL
ncbi:MAG: hypothetical protein R3D51_17845 [Hyphomicrobiaceae bacterium]